MRHVKEHPLVVIDGCYRLFYCATISLHVLYIQHCCGVYPSQLWPRRLDGSFLIGHPPDLCPPDYCLFPSLRPLPHHHPCPPSPALAAFRPGVSIDRQAANTAGHRYIVFLVVRLAVNWEICSQPPLTAHKQL